MDEIFNVLSLISLLLGMLGVTIQRVWGECSAKDYFFTARVAIVASVVFSLLFQESAFGAPYFAINEQTLSVYALTSVMVYIWLSLSLKWFVSENLPSCLFCFLALVALLCCRVLAAAQNLMIIFAALAVLMLINYLFLYLSQQTEELHNISSRYGLSALLFVFVAGIALYLLTPKGWNLAQAADMTIGWGLFKTYVVVAGFLFVFMFMLAIAPLHFWFADTIAPAVLPVAAYLSLVPQLSLWTAFGNVHHQFLQPIMNNINDLRLNNNEFSGDTDKYPYEPILPRISGCGGDLIYYEVDIGTTGTDCDPRYPSEIYNDGYSITRGAARIVYSRYYESDGSLITSLEDRYVFYTYNHYNDFQEYLNYQNGWGEIFGNITGGGEISSYDPDFPPTDYVPSIRSSLK